MQITFSRENAFRVQNLLYFCFLSFHLFIYLFISWVSCQCGLVAGTGGQMYIKMKHESETCSFTRYFIKKNVTYKVGGGKEK